MSDDIARYLNDVQYSREYVQDPRGQGLQRIIHETPASGKFFENSGRHVVQVKYNGVPLSFYLSSGQSPKDGVAAGKWYPVFGIGEDGWFNKGQSKDMANYYGNKGWKDVAQWLDARIGDVRDKDDSKSSKTELDRQKFIERSGLRRVRVVPVSDAVLRESLAKGYGIGQDKPSTQQQINSFLETIRQRASGQYQGYQASPAGSSGINPMMINQYGRINTGTNKMFIPKIFE